MVISTNVFKLFQLILVPNIVQVFELPKTDLQAHNTPESTLHAKDSQLKWAGYRFVPTVGSSTKANMNSYAMSFTKSHDRLSQNGDWGHGEEIYDLVGWLCRDECIGGVC